ncbi:MAG: dihydrolipoyl dehydrogenase [Alistipes sp.]|nr:dihydrolipoyl dehydrogenase [Alistipes sp.]
MMFDLAIIGGGPAGYVAAERAASKGLSVILFEKKELGGVCLNEGCIPTKTLLYSAKLFDNAVGGSKYGVHAGDVNLDYARIIDRKNKVVRKLVAGVAAKMKAHNVTVVKGEAMIEGRSESGIEITSGPEKYAASNLLVCTGSEAFIPPIPGIETAGEALVTSREILASKERGASLVVIGGGVIGMEFASFFNSLGTTVTVIEMLPEILGGLDAEISAALREIYTKKGVKFNLGCKVTAIDGNRVEYTDPENHTHSIEADRILMSVGRRPATSGFGLERLGIEMFRGGIKVDERMRTNIPNVFAAGDVTGFSMLAHTASREGEVVVNNLTGRRDVMRYDAVPGVVYTNPEVAGTGHTLASALAAGIDAEELKLPMSYAGRFVAENEGVNGMCKVVVGREHGQVLGVHMIGNPCSEIIYGACMAIEKEMTVKELEEVIFPHPTVSEIIRETIFTTE